MWILMLITMLGFFGVLASLRYVRRRADEDEAASDRAAIREAEQRAQQHLQYLTQKAWQQRLDDQRHRNGRGW